MSTPIGEHRPQPWNKGLLVGQKRPLEPKHVWSIRVRLEIARSRRDPAILNLAIDSKLRAGSFVREASSETRSPVRCHASYQPSASPTLIRSIVARISDVSAPPYGMSFNARNV
jgi:hypothetical protein